MATPEGQIRRIDNENDDDSTDSGVNAYFNQCDKLPNVIIFKDSPEIEKLKLGKQIRIYKKDSNTDVDQDIYVITKINNNNDLGMIETIDVKSTTGDTIEANLDLKKIYNIVNINPQSMYIDEDFLKKVLLTDAEKLSTREKLKLEFNKNLALKIKSKQLEHNDSLLALKENNINIETTSGNIKKLLDEMYEIPDDSVIATSIKSLKDSAREYYYIQYFNTILEALNISPENKDKLINNYIFLCECLSVTVIAGAMEIGFTKHSWIYYMLYKFLVIVKNIPGVNNYIIMPAITVYLYTNMDTLYLSTTNLFGIINELLSIILCSLTNLSKIICGNDDDDDDKSNASNLSIVSAASNTTLKTLETVLTKLTESTESTLKTVSTFPSLQSLQSLASENLESELKSIFTQEKNTYPSQSTILTQDSYLREQLDEETEEIGGKRKYKTKKHKKHTKKSKQSKKNKRVKRNNKKTRKPKNRRNNHTKK